MMRRGLFLILFLFPLILSAQEFDQSGYFRIRTKSIDEKSLSKTNYLESRFRWEPEIKIAERLSILMQMDLDGIWGAHNSIFDIDSEVNEINFKFNRAWLKYMTPAGLLEIGRMPSDWGMGIFTNDGNGFDDLFGDNYDGDTFDRILFGTKPLGRESPLTTAIIFDQVSTGTVMNVNDDVSELILAVIYNELNYITGAYGGMRLQDSTDTEAYFGDIYLKLNLYNLTLEAESLYLHGRTRALQTSLNQGIYIIDQAGAAGKVTFSGRFIEPSIEAGFASGDNNPLNRHVTQFTFHRDYNVGLILYEEVLAQLTDAMYQNFSTLGEFPPPGTERLSTKGGVTNSWYIFPAVKVLPRDDLTLVLAGLYARSIFPFKDIVKFIKTNQEFNLMGGEPSKELGWEVDFSGEWEAIKNLRTGIQAGYFSPGDAFRDAEGKLHPVYTIQGRLTWVY